LGRRPAEREPAPAAREASDVKQLQGLTGKARFLTQPACVEACLEHLGADVSDSWLWGACGYAFFLNVADSFCPSSMFTHRFNMHERGTNVGYAVDAVFSWKDRDDFADSQKLAWDKARQALDQGLPCMLWEWEWLLVYGYDDAGYYLRQPGHEETRGPVPWQDLGTTPVGWLELVIIAPADAADDPTTVREALQFAVEFWETPETWTTRDKGGRPGYDQWTAAVEQSSGDGPEAARTAAIYAECRQFAVAFLREASTRLGADLAPLFDEGIAHYDVVAQSLGAVTDALPYLLTPGLAEAAQEAANQQMDANYADQQRRQTAVEALKAAREAEASGIEALKGILAEL
jgi:hypothetical protein